MTPEERNTVIEALEAAAMAKLADGTYLDKDCKITRALVIMRMAQEPAACAHLWMPNECCFHCGKYKNRHEQI